MNEAGPKRIASYFSLVKFSHTIFALPFAVTGYFLGVLDKGTRPDWYLFLLVILCMVFARNAAMGFNRYADREIDKANPRTAEREIPKGIIEPRRALVFVVINALLFIATTAFINRLTLLLSPVALAIVLGYTLTKKFTSLCHFILGLGLSLAPVGAYLAVTGSFSLLPVFYALLVLFWVSGFDILYALQDEDFDRKMSLKSLAVRLGTKRAIWLSAGLHAITAVMILIIGLFANFGNIYWAGAFVFAGLLVYQHLLVKPNNLSRLNVAFFTMNGVASLLFAVFNITDLFLKF